MKKLILSLLTLAVVLPSAVSCGKKGDDSIKVMSYNIRMGIANDGENHWNLRKDAVAALINTVSPDIFGVQEAFEFQKAFILENCPEYNCVGVGRDDGTQDGEQMAIFWKTDKYELLEWGTYWLSETPDVPSFGWDAACRRTATWTKLKEKANGREFFYVNTHLDHVGREARKNGLAMVVERIAAMNPEGFPLFLTGDFNVTPDDEALVGLDKLMTSARVSAEQTDNSITFNGWGDVDEQCVIDYVYYSGMSSCKSFRVVNEPYLGRAYTSDHYPVVADIVF